MSIPNELGQLLTSSPEELYLQLLGTRHPAKSTASEICQTTWGKGGIAFRCFDCEKDDNCVVCAACYFRSEHLHANHRVKLIRTQGGCCDCGDVSSWSSEGCCDLHGPNSVRLESNCMPIICGDFFPTLLDLMSKSNEDIFLAGIAFLSDAVNVADGALRQAVLDSLTESVLHEWITCSAPARRDALGAMFLSFIQLCAEFKIRFSRVYLSHYKQIISADPAEDNQFALSGLSVQLFTIPAVCQDLGPNLLEVILTTLSQLLETVREPGAAKFGRTQIRGDIEVSLWRVFHDLGYCFAHSFVCESLLISPLLMDLLINQCISPLHLANVQSIKHGEHVIYENIVWRTTFKIEALLGNTLSALGEFCRKNSKKSEIFLNKIAFVAQGFSVAKFAGEKGSFHLPLTRFLAVAVSDDITFSEDVLLGILCQSVRTFLLVSEVAADVWVRNGESMRYQAAEYATQYKWMDVAAVQLILNRKHPSIAWLELVRAFTLCMIDVPDDSWAPESGLGHRLAYLDTLGPEELTQFSDMWWQSLLRDLVVGGNGNAIDELRRKCVLTSFLEILVLVTSDTSVIDLVRLDQLPRNEDQRKRLIEKCLVQQLAGQQLSYSALLAGLPAPLRQPERLVETLVDELATRDPSAGTYKLTAKSLQLFDVYHRVFPVSSTVFHAREDFVIKHTLLIGSNPSELRLGSTDLLVRFLTGLLRTRCALLRVPGCLEEDTLGQLDSSVGLALRVLANLGSCTSQKVYDRPPIGTRMQLHSLVQRADLDGEEGIYFGQQQGRYCVSTRVEGRVLTKDSNTRIMGATTLTQLLDELVHVDPPIAPLVLATAKQLRTRLSGQAEPVQAVAGPSRANAARQALLLGRMRAKQARFTSNTEEEEQTDENSTSLTCFMCREPSGAPLLVVGYCAPGDAVARLSPPTCGVARAPYISSCMHTVHTDCWAQHVEATARRVIRGDYSLLHDDEVQCPVCRTVCNCAIPVDGDAMSFGEQILSLVRDPNSSGLWLSRTQVPWRPRIFPPGHDALVEAAFNELLLSIALTPNRILSPFSLTVVLVNCIKAAAPGVAKWAVWDTDPLAASTVDCGRLFVESGHFEVSFIEQLLALRFVQRASEDELAQLAVLFAWTMIAANYQLYTPAQVNRIGYLPELSGDKLTVIEAVLGVGGWRARIPEMASRVLMAPNVIAPHAIGGLVKFVHIDTLLTNVIKSTLHRACLGCNTQPDDPAICLLCGSIVCLDADCCRSNSEGECTQHARTCGADQGVFLLPYASIVLAVAAPRNCIWEGPYEDSHGEPDSYLKRSCKLVLSERRIDQMRLFYTRASIPTEIVRQNEISGRYVPRPL